MKKKVLGLTALLLMAVVTVFAGEKTEKFKVKGNCGMCEKRIEKAAQAVDGVKAADWNQETKMMEVTFNDEITDVDKVQMAIAGAGHDTGKHKASDEVYKELPMCCQYDRTGKDHKQEGNHQH